MRFFEEIEPGELLQSAGLVVDGAEAADFAERYDPAYVPPSGVAYVHRGPQISPWQAAALSWKLLCDLAASADIYDAAFSRPSELQWHTRVSADDVLRVEVEVVEKLPPMTSTPLYGWARAKVTLVTTGAAGFGAWGDDDAERVDDLALTYLVFLKARRARPVSIYEGL